MTGSGGGGESIVLTALPPVWADHPLLVADTGRWLPRQVWATPEAFLAVVAGAETGVLSLLGLGEPAPLASLTAQVAGDDGDGWAGRLGVTRASLTRGTWEELPTAVRAGSGLEGVSSWDWFWADGSMLRAAADPASGGATVELSGGGGHDTARIADLHALALPGTSFVSDRPGVFWTGWVAAGQLLAVAGAADRDRASQLGGVATHPDARGLGLGAAVVSVAARAAAQRRGLVCLGMYADNHAARSLYTRLGFAVGQEFDSFERQAA